MRTRTVTALLAAGTLAAATAAVPTTAQERCLGCGIGGLEYPIAPRGYAYYPGYGEPLPGSNCYWFRRSAYDASGNMIGWRGRPVAFCSWLSGFRPWPLR
jgi:hypothetical protein